MSSRVKKRHRAFARRSRNGCQTCKSRHLRCDESIPVWLGRQCSYEELTPEQRLASHTSPHNDSSRLKVTEASYQQLLSFSGAGRIPDYMDITVVLRSARTPSPLLDSRINYISPLHANLGPSATTLLHHYQGMVAHVLIGPQYGHKVALTEHFPRVLQVGCTHEFVKHSLVHMEAMKYFLVTGQADGSRVMERYQARALRGLQEAIVSCGPQNSDAIIAASILMMEGAQDWQQWMIYLSGYSAALALNLPTNLSEIRSPKFILQLFPRTSSHTMHTLPPPGIRSSSQARVATILQSLAEVKPLLLAKKEEHSSSFEFRHIGILGESLRNVHRADRVDDVFNQFALLKGWMFCMELRTSARRDVYGEFGAKVVRLHFYGFLEAMIPYFPPSCRERLMTVCGGEIPRLREEIVMDGDHDVRELVERLWR